jgi:hypothetical protein
MPRKPGSTPSKPFVKGDSRINRKGRPLKGLTFAEWVRDAMESPNEATGRRKVDMLIDEAMRRALKGNFQFWDALVARGYGKVADKIEVNQQEKPDLSKLTDEEIKEWQRLLQKAK